MLLALVSVDAFSQKKYSTKTGHAYFFSDSPMEKIEANNNQVTAIITETGEVAFRVTMKAFEFEKALMQEHFNENYVESEKYPRATFEGKVLNMKEVNLAKDGVYKVQVEGDLALHGVTKKITESGTITIKDGKVNINCEFNILLSDYNIKIPSAVKENINNQILVKIKATLEEYKK
jgi:polyisoprenoid-binding protein YceI